MVRHRQELSKKLCSACYSCFQHPSSSQTILECPCTACKKKPCFVKITPLISPSLSEGQWPWGTLSQGILEWGYHPWLPSCTACGARGFTKKKKNTIIKKRPKKKTSENSCCFPTISYSDYPFISIVQQCKDFFLSLWYQLNPWG